MTGHRLPWLHARCALNFECPYFVMLSLAYLKVSTSSVLLIYSIADIKQYPQEKQLVIGRRLIIILILSLEVTSIVYRCIRLCT